MKQRTKHGCMLATGAGCGLLLAMLISIIRDRTGMASNADNRAVAYVLLFGGMLVGKWMFHRFDRGATSDEQISSEVDEVDEIKDQ